MQSKLKCIIDQSPKNYTKTKLMSKAGPFKFKPPRSSQHPPLETAVKSDELLCDDLLRVLQLSSGHHEPLRSNGPSAVSGGLRQPYPKESEILQVADTPESPEPCNILHGCPMMIKRQRHKHTVVERCNGSLAPCSMHCHLHRSDKVNWTTIIELTPKPVDLSNAGISKSAAADPETELLKAARERSLLQLLNNDQYQRGVGNPLHGGNALSPSPRRFPPNTKCSRQQRLLIKNREDYPLEWLQ